MSAPTVIGYTERFSVAPGESTALMLGGDVARVDADVVRLFHGDERSLVGLVEQAVATSLEASLHVAAQPVHRGSFGIVDCGETVRSRARKRLGGHVLVHPTVIETGSPQGVLAQEPGAGSWSWELVLEGAGALSLRVREGDAVRGVARVAGAMSQGRWHSVAFAIDWKAGVLELWCTAVDAARTGETRAATGLLGAPRDAACAVGSLLLAARALRATAREPRALDTFNGKLERPALVAGGLGADDAAALARGRLPGERGLELLVDLDLARGSSGWDLHDVSPHRHAGRLYNAPLRACTSHAWRGATLAPALAPAAHAAIHFHDDDLHHADWEPSAELSVPRDMPSGVYAVRLRGEGCEDRVPFVVRPPRDRATAPVALWLPSFTYAAYANARHCLAGFASEGFVPERTAADALLDDHPDWGSSTYDVHRDGSGVAISSLGRPVPNLRPTYRAGLVNGPRHLGADLYLVHWLRHVGMSADVICDEDVHLEGSALLRRYPSVITGSHPEYVTAAELDAVEDYAADGGRLMYMGGNGFYWVTSVQLEPWVTVEVRRSFAGTRAWDPQPGEEHHQFDGDPGGLWRHRGRPPHALLGVGFVAEGWDGRNRPYRRSSSSFGPAAAWAFEGIGPHEPLGDRGLIMGGAAGDEIDSADPARGTSSDTIVLASSWGHGAVYRSTVENARTTRDVTAGDDDARLRADITLTPQPKGGAVFSVGSISFTGSLSVDGYDNPLARLSTNVLRAFASGRTPWRADAETTANDPGGLERERHEHDVN